jgi:hypothetical protein
MRSSSRQFGDLSMPSTSARRRRMWIMCFREIAIVEEVVDSKTRRRVGLSADTKSSTKYGAGAISS